MRVVAIGASAGRALECIAYVFDGVLSSFPGQVHDTVQMKVKAQIGTAGMARLNSLSEQPEKLLRKPPGE